MIGDDGDGEYWGQVTPRRRHPLYLPISPHPLSLTRRTLTHSVGKEIWGSPLASDGKVHIGDRDGTFAILAADKTKNLLATIKFDDEIASTPTAANGTLYVSTLARLYAVQ